MLKLSVSDVLYTLTVAGLQLQLIDDELKVVGDTTKLTPQLKQSLVTHKDTLRLLLLPPPATDEPAAPTPATYVIATGKVACPHCLCSWIEETGATTVCWSCRQVLASGEAIPTTTTRYEEAVNQLIGGNIATATASEVEL